MLAGLFLFTGAGCAMTTGQKAAALQFSVATQELAAMSAIEFRMARADVIAMNVLRRKLDDPVPTSLDGNLTLARTRVRTAVADALNQYAELLGTLVTSDQAAPLKTAADEFVSSIRRVDGVGISDTQAGDISKAVSLVGGWFLEYKRKQAVRQVVETASPSIRQLLVELERDFDPNGANWSLAYDSTTTALRGAGAIKKMDPVLGATAREAMALADANNARFNAISKSILTALGAAKQAEIELVYVMQSDAITAAQIDEFLAAAKIAVDTHKSLRAR